jgi:hypothetical protein
MIKHRVFDADSRQSSSAVPNYGVQLSSTSSPIVSPRSPLAKISGFFNQFKRQKQLLATQEQLPKSRSIDRSPAFNDSNFYIRVFPNAVCRRGSHAGQPFHCIVHMCEPAVLEPEDSAKRKDVSPTDDTLPVKNSTTATGAAATTTVAATSISSSQSQSQSQWLELGNPIIIIELQL